MKACFVPQRLPAPFSQLAGAQIVTMEPDSPLRWGDLQPGDIVVMLDLVDVSRGAHQRRDPATGTVYWAIPELERHGPRSSARFLRSGTFHLQDVTVNFARPYNPAIAVQLQTQSLLGCLPQR